MCIVKSVRTDQNTNIYRYYNHTCSDGNLIPSTIYYCFATKYLCTIVTTIIILPAKFIIIFYDIICYTE